MSAPLLVHRSFTEIGILCTTGIDSELQLGFRGYPADPLAVLLRKCRFMLSFVRFYLDLPEVPFFRITAIPWCRYLHYGKQ